MTPGFRPSVLMGAPDCFEIRGGANPHTRDRWGRRKKVNKPTALVQWKQLATRLTDLGVDVYVAPAQAGSPGMVYPANAGFLTRLNEQVPLDQKTFLLSRALPTREAERRFFGAFLSELGFSIDDSFPLRFEGEADLFPVGNDWIFTSGPLKEQRFVPRWGWPPWRRVYGFRSDPAAAPLLTSIVQGPLVPLALVNESFYHGDTCLCSFGPEREFLMVYPPALTPDSVTRLRDRFGDRLIVLDDRDGGAFAANSFQTPGKTPTLVMPTGVSDGLRKKIEDRGVRVETIDVTEFFSKGGGSVKCMIADLGFMPIQASPPVQTFRKKYLFRPI